ncbi:MAG: P-II family nitrogen regulator, partial [Clostridiales bacterium]|nr:P-II family nitrogen regulator [Clostridiales bacterium]
KFFQNQNLSTTFQMIGRVTSASEIIDYLGLEGSEKNVLLSVVTDENWEKIKKALQNKMKIDVPGTGVAFTIPMSSVGGKRQLMFLTENQNFKKGEESTLKDTDYELLVAIANQGYISMVMDAARSAGASGGTVLHAKGTGMERAEQFLGVSLVAEKEIILTVVKRKKKNDIMQAIMADAGLDSEAKTIVFSLPVTATAGMRLIEEED